MYRDTLFYLLVIRSNFRWLNCAFLTLNQYWYYNGVICVVAHTAR